MQSSSQAQPSSESQRRNVGPRQLALAKLKKKLLDIAAAQGKLAALHDEFAAARQRQAARQSANPLNHFGAKYFSQSDEDGITIEILRRLGLTDGVFCEYGCGNGLENNSLVLLSLGWSGLWVGGESLCFGVDPSWKKLSFTQAWVTKDNAVGLLRAGLGDREPNVISVDLDGNDLYIVKELLTSRLRPDLWIVEFNGKFPPNSNFSIPYDQKFRWGADDYFGAALGAFVELFGASEYKLVAVNSATGANAFFVKAQQGDRFEDVPTKIEDIIQTPNYRLPRGLLHAQSPATIKRMIELNELR